MISNDEAHGTPASDDSASPRAGRTPTDRAPTDAPTSTSGSSTGDGFWRIDQVSARTGLTKRTLRYYEEIGLLEPPTRTEGGYRLYSEADIQHLQRIKRLRDLLGFSLKEIREIAEAEEEREQVRAAWASEPDPRTRLAWLDHMIDQTRRQLSLVEEKVAGLKDMQATLQARLEKQEQRRAELQAQVAEEESR